MPRYYSNAVCCQVLRLISDQTMDKEETEELLVAFEHLQEIENI